MGETDLRKEQPKVIVELGAGAGSGPGAFDRVFLLNRDGRPNALDLIDVGSIDLFQEESRIGRERLDIAPLSFRKDRVERQGRFSRPAQARDGRHAIVRDIECNSLEIVLAGSANRE